MLSGRSLGWLAVAGSLWSAGPLPAAQTNAGGERLVELINEYRASPQACRGKPVEAAGPLTSDARLQRPATGAKQRLTDELRKAGYAAARAQAVRLEGPRSAAEAMQLLKERYCGVILDRSVAHIGIARSGDAWRIVLAQPLLSPALGDWRKAGKEVLALVNAARGEARTCGDRHFQAAGPLTWNEALAAAALAHSRDMAQRSDLAHRGRKGSEVGDRATREGYRWRHIGENIATGQGSARQVVAGWIASPQHCANIMDPAFAEMGAAYATNRDSSTGIYWTQVFGTRRN